MMRRLLLGVLVLVAACRPKPEHPIADSTNVAVDSTPDASVTDTGEALDTTGWTSEGTEIDTFPPVNPDSLPSPRRGMRSAGNVGLATGLYNLDTHMWGASGEPMNSVAMNVLPVSAASVMRSVNATNMRLLIVIPRRLITTTGGTHAPFSMTKAKQTIDAYAVAGLNASAKTYSKNLIGMNLADDYGCAPCWGGKIVTQAEIAEWAAYARQKLPNVPLGIRVEPFWANADIAKNVDFATCQYRTKKGEINKYLSKCATDATRLGMKAIMGQNFTNCSLAGDSAACTNDELKKYGEAMVRHPYNCSFMSWWYDNDYARAKPVWDYLSKLAAARPWTTCTRGGPVVASDSTGLPVIASADSVVPASVAVESTPHRKPKHP